MTVFDRHPWVPWLVVGVLVAVLFVTVSFCPGGAWEANF